MLRNNFSEEITSTNNGQTWLLCQLFCPFNGEIQNLYQELCLYTWKRKFQFCFWFTKKGQKYRYLVQIRQKLYLLIFPEMLQFVQHHLFHNGFPQNSTIALSKGDHGHVHYPWQAPSFLSQVVFNYLSNNLEVKIYLHLFIKSFSHSFCYNIHCFVIAAIIVDVAFITQQWF